LTAREANLSSDEVDAPDRGRREFQVQFSSSSRKFKMSWQQPED